MIQTIQQARRWATQHPKTMAIAIMVVASWTSGIALWTEAITKTVETLDDYQTAKQNAEAHRTAQRQAQSVLQRQASSPIPAQVQPIAVITSSVARSVRPEWIFPELFRVDFPSLGSPRLNIQVRLYAAYLALFGPPDILIVGSSRSLQGIDPATLQAELSQQGYDDVRVYNFSVNGATAQVVDVMVRQVLHPDQLPDLVIWGDGSRAFNSGRNDSTYEQIIASPGYQQILTGDRPISYKTFDADLFSDCSAPDPTLDRPSSSSIEEGVAYYDFAPNPPGQECDRLIEFSTPLRRWERDRLVLQRRWVDQYGGGLNSLGFQSILDQFEPRLYYQRYSRVPGAYDSSYVPFQLDGEQTSAAVRLAEYLQRQDIPLVAVNLPLSSDYLDYSRQRWEREFREYMTKLAQQHGFAFHDLDQAELRNNSYFADPSHLNATGARVVARILAQDETIPWSTVLE